MHVDADAYDGESYRRVLALRFDKNAAGFARADEQIVGPADVDGETGDSADSVGGGEAGGEGKQGQARGGNLRTENTLT